MNTTPLSKLLMRPQKEADTPFFRILTEGRFPKEQIITIWGEEQVTYPEEVQNIISENWAKILGKYPKTFSGSMVRLNALGQDAEGNLVLELGPTNYKDYVWSKTLSGEELRALNFKVANPLAVAVMVFSKAAFGGNGGLLFERRSATIPHRPGALAFPGGNVTKGDINRQGRIDPALSGLRELQEEQSIKPDELENIRAIGVAYETYEDAAPVLLITASLRPGVSLEELKSRSKDNEGEALWVSSEPRELVKMVVENAHASSSVVPAGMYLYLRANFLETKLAESLVTKLRNLTAR